MTCLIRSGLSILRILLRLLIGWVLFIRDNFVLEIRVGGKEISIVGASIKIGAHRSIADRIIEINIKIFLIVSSIFLISTGPELGPEI